MQTPNYHLRALLLERAEEAGLTDSAIAQAHHRAYPDRDTELNIGTVNLFRYGYTDKKGVKRQADPNTPPTELIEEAFAVALGTTRTALWNEAFRRWRAALKREAEQSVQRQSE